SRVLVGDRATAEALETYGPAARVIHIASHGEHVALEPWSSSLFLAGSGTSGHYTAAHFRKLDLSEVDLVVLAGCETGIGDGQAGFPRALAEAGAHWSVVSTRPVEDGATAELMRCLYHHLDRGLPPPAALRAAKLDRYASVKASANETEPYAWAPWIIVPHTLRSEVTAR
ncbi:MAG: CHAT domain-containing protein, partial [Planctomycetes bacterium]|nr:CHAT domain-containing protein [Planctomycetota bacterium]